jgi:mannose-6-phosphate isomerase-like protein (cupin superfamily)
MKLPICIAAVIVICTSFKKLSLTELPQQKTYFVEHESDIRIQQPSPHGAAGITTSYPYFSKVENFNTVFRKRTLKKGSSIGYHLQQADEIYYIVSGKGIMKMNGETFTVTAGDAILTRPGNWHGLEPLGNDSLTVIINYQQK